MEQDISRLPMGTEGCGNQFIGATDNGVYTPPVHFEALEFDRGEVHTTTVRADVIFLQYFDVHEHCLSAHSPLGHQPISLFISSYDHIQS